MSDGNFNKALLPKTSYQSGLRAGKAIMKKLAIEKFEESLEEIISIQDVQDKEKLILQFKQKLESE